MAFGIKLQQTAATPPGGGIVSINSDETAAQTLNVGTGGSDFNVSDTGTGTHTFNLPTASATVRGALSTTDWSTFNAKGDMHSSANLSDVANASTSRTNLGVAIGTNVQAWNANLDAFALKTAPTGVVVGTTDSQTLTNKTLTTPTIGSFTNATHNHTNAAGGGQLTDAAFSSAIGFAKGGTSFTSYTDGQLLIGNTATGGLSKATLTAGSGIVITNGNGTISIASTGAAGNNATFATITHEAGLTNSRQILGTTNQVILTDNGAGSTLVFSLPQSIATSSSPSFAGATMTGRLHTAQGANVASANDMTLGTDGNSFLITGTTQINRIATAGWSAGDRIVLLFNNTLTFKTGQSGGGGFAGVLLDGTLDLITAPNTVLELIYDGTNFQQISVKSP